ncbi:hypothetical protein, partial [Streptomyces caniscabiei]|uniref:hypothetical protein n=1 Tax=Streptomyces caniscabiei TaxID=2746961 RepID=UPI00117C6C41
MSATPAPGPAGHPAVTGQARGTSQGSTPQLHSPLPETPEFLEKQGDLMRLRIRGRAATPDGTGSRSGRRTAALAT